MLIPLSVAFCNIRPCSLWQDRRPEDPVGGVATGGSGGGEASDSEAEADNQVTSSQPHLFSGEETLELYGREEAFEGEHQPHSSSGGGSGGAVRPGQDEATGQHPARRPMNAFLLFCKKHRKQVGVVLCCRVFVHLTY